MLAYMLLRASSKRAYARVSGRRQRGSRVTLRRGVRMAVVTYVGVQETVGEGGRGGG